MAAPAQAQPVQVSAATHSIALAGHLWASVAQDTIAGPEAALERYRSAGFEKLPGNLSRGYRSGDVWLAFELQAAQDAPGLAVLEVGPAFLDYVRAWQTDSKGQLISLGLAGDDVAPDQIALAAFQPSFNLRLQSGGATTVLLQIQTSSVQAAIVNLYHDLDFPARQADYGLLLGVIFTISLVMLVLALSQYLQSRNHLYLLWLAYLGVTNGQWFMEDGLAYKFIDFAYLDSIVNLNNLLAVFGQALGIVVVVVLFRFKSLHKQLHHFFIGWALCTLAIGLFAVLSSSARLLNLLTFSNILFCFTALLLVSWQMFRHQRSSLWFGPWFLLYMLAAASNQLASIGLLPYSGITFYGWQLAGFLNLLALQTAIFTTTRLNQRRHLQERSEFLAQLKRKNAELEEQVAARTQTLSQALHDLQQAESEQRQLLSMASHEFRTPAAMIKASLDSLAILRDKIPPEVNLRLGNMRQASLRLAELTHSLISQDRLHELSLKPRLLPVDLCQLVQLVLSRYTEPKPLLLDFPETPLTVNGDMALLSIALHNLIDNAMRHGQPAQGGDQCVTVRLQMVVDQIELQVADNGPGIPDNEKEKVFQRFHAVDRRRRQTDGPPSSQPSSGLGLSIVKSIALAHGGKALVRDQQPRGSILVLVLPIT